jgi:lysophospholipase L1-like esterase
MPSPLPVLPQGVNPAAYPYPRTDWFERVVRNNATATAQSKNIKIIFDGDSITDGWQGPGKLIWQDHYVKLGAMNYGLPGDRTQNLLWRLAQGQAVGLSPKLIVLMIGTNNFNSRSDSPAAIAMAIKEIITRYRSLCPDAVILLQGVLPRGADPMDQKRDQIKQLNTLISSNADGEMVLFIDFGEKFLLPDGRIDKDLMPDCLHPNEKGYEIWAAAIQPLLEEMLK